MLLTEAFHSNRTVAMSEHPLKPGEIIRVISENPLSPIYYTEMFDAV